MVSNTKSIIIVSCCISVIKCQLHTIQGEELGVLDTYAIVRQLRWSLPSRIDLADMILSGQSSCSGGKYSLEKPRI